MQTDLSKLQAGLAQLQQLLQRKKLTEAEHLAKAMLSRWPRSVPLLLLSARLSQMLGNFDEMLNLAKTAQRIEPGNQSLSFQVLEYRIYCGQFEQVLKELAKLESKIGSDANGWRQISHLYTSCGKHQEAFSAISRAHNLSKADPNLLFNYSSSLIALGRLDEAEKGLERLIQIAPHDYPAYMNRSSLRKQTEQSNHIDQLREILKQPFRHAGGEAQICYALGKESEDLDRSEDAFKYYQQGADARRKLLSYGVESDVRLMDRMIELFDQDLVNRTSADLSSPGPIFVMGLPRSGTTLVDRILASHEDVESLGEINDFALALVRTAKAGTDKHNILEAVPHIDAQLLGERYQSSTKGRGCDSKLLIDKTPLNYLYLGLIHLALPHARIIYVRRNAMDVCFAMYKTLFLMGYPFSYSIEDLAQYYSAFDRLMTHWQRVLPERFLTIDYERLVAEQEESSRQMLEYCGLDWDSNCLNFHSNQSASATASAAQVRQPIYSSSLNRWKLYEKQLEPLRRQLLDLGVCL